MCQNPLALGTDPGAEERRAVAVVVIGGQALCLLLTLVVTPVAYSLLTTSDTRQSNRPGRLGGIFQHRHRLTTEPECA
jgi:HAE1 family hydrophobic/amphiphilic exporter-1